MYKFCLFIFCKSIIVSSYIINETPIQALKLSIGFCLIYINKQYNLKLIVCYLKNLLFLTCATFKQTHLNVFNHLRFMINLLLYAQYRSNGSEKFVAN